LAIALDLLADSRGIWWALHSSRIENLLQISAVLKAPAKSRQHCFHLGQCPKAAGMSQPLLRSFFLNDQVLKQGVGLEAGLLLAC
ncbi:MAG: hypothetical protein RLZZ11_878, partial [Cyanobacteriota bacterium]